MTTVNYVEIVLKKSLSADQFEFFLYKFLHLFDKFLLSSNVDLLREMHQLVGRLIIYKNIERAT